MGIVKTDIISISELISKQNLRIPEYQRPYKWTQSHVNQLLNDIKRFSGSNTYRIGTIVIHQDDKVWNIVDGQQRCLTFTLIARALILHRLKNVKNEKLKEQLAKIKEVYFKPSFSNRTSQHNLKSNYFEIDRYIQKVSEDWIEYFLNKCEVTLLVIDDESEAFQFFDSQNARGKDLEPHDLLKAFHLRELNRSNERIEKAEINQIVETWQDIQTEELARHFSDFLFRVRGWSRSQSSKYFSKNDTHLFKGITLNKDENYPYIKPYNLLGEYLINKDQNNSDFPFQLDQLIINGRLFFEMVIYYLRMRDEILEQLENEKGIKNILDTLNKYDGKDRTGDKYSRMLFDCAILYYVDKFGKSEIDVATEKIFIWAYTPRLNYQNLTLASIDNYVIHERNIFFRIKDAIHPSHIINWSLPRIKGGYKNEKTKDIRILFENMNYYESSRN